MSERFYLSRDLKLLKYLKPAFKPFKGLIIASIAMIMAAALISLVLPYLTKVAIDQYILPLGRLVTPGDKTLPAELEALLTHDDLEPTTQEGVFFISARKAAGLDARQEKNLTQAGLLAPERYYFRPIDSGFTQKEALDLAARSNLLQIWPKGLAVKESDLPRLPGGVNLILRGADLSGLKKLALFFAVLMILGYFFDLGQRYYLESGAQKMSHELRSLIMAHLMNLSQSFYDHQQSGRLTSRLTSDINNINALIKSTAASFFSDFLSLFGVTAIMFLLNPTLAAITLILTPLAGFLSWRYGHEAREIHRDLRAKVAAINQSFNESINGLMIIQAFNREKETEAGFEELNEANFKAGARQVHSVAVFLPLVDLCATMVLSLVLWFGGLAVLDNTVTLGVLAAFVGYAGRFFIPIKDLAEKLNTFQSAFASLERIEELLENQNILSPKEPVLLPGPAGGLVEMKNVSFSYGPGRPVVIKDLSLTIRPGESVAIVGATGSGKSSLISLLLRFYDPTAGEIFFDGLPLNSLDIKAHRRRLSLVTQDVYLSSGTVLENLRLGRHDLPEEKIVAAAAAVGADRFIRRLPRGYDEPLGSSGQSLSAGQRQLLACARALIDAPQIIILDEATAFVDTETELLIEKALATVLAGRTSIIIAHRLSTIRRSNRILVMESGQLVEEGSHEELLALKGIYSHLAVLQGLSIA
ncbi:MAG: ABC transporter ATP-binding protein/permease [Deltaproteobacteria bacterium]|nr:ABC transporter ATP-binding protein/permease [Deltaproteobacteria bacterium]